MHAGSGLGAVAAGWAQMSLTREPDLFVGRDYLAENTASLHLTPRGTIMPTADVSTRVANSVQVSIGRRALCETSKGDRVTYRKFASFAIAATTVAVGALVGNSTPHALAETIENGVPEPTVQQIEDSAAKRTALALADSAWKSTLQTNLVSTQPADLQALTSKVTDTAYTTSVVGWNGDVLSLKGLPSSTGSLLTVRLAHSSMVTAFKSGVDPLVAAVRDDDNAPRTITAYAKTGETVTLSADAIPTRPVLMVGIDVRKAQAVGIEMMNDILAPGPAAPSTQTTVDTTRINEIRVHNDHENWWRGDAEMFTIVAGVGKTNQKPLAKVVNMPFLNDEDVTYRPNLTLIFWDQWYYDLADMLMFESDGDTNYSALATAINGAIAALCERCSKYAPIAQAVINAIPTQWWTDDPDHVEQWYSLQKASSGQVFGASNNGWMRVSPVPVDVND